MFFVVSNRTKLLPLYLSTIGHSHRQESIDRPTGFHKHQFLAVISGNGRFLCADKVESVCAGDWIFLKKDEPHGYYGVGEDFSTRWISFDGSCVDGLLSYYGVTGSEVYRGAGKNLVKEHESLLRFCESGANEEERSFYCYRFFTSFFSTVRKKKPSVSKALRYMEEHFAETVELDRLAEISEMNRFAFCKAFKSEMGASPFEYLLMLRIREAKYILGSERGVSTKEVARRCGFNDSGYFCRVFRKYENCSPKRFTPN